MPLTTNGQWGPEALIDTASGRPITDGTITVPAGYAFTFTGGNLTITGPPGAVTFSVTRNGSAQSFTVNVDPAVSELGEVADKARAAATPADVTAAVAPKADQAAVTTALAAKLDTTTASDTYRARSNPTAPATAPTAWISVKDYGALGNGTADDTAAFTAALAAAKTLNVRRIEVPYTGSHYKVSDEFTLNTDGLQIVGAGAGLVEIRQVTQNKHLFKIVQDPTAALVNTNRFGLFQNLKLTGPGGGTTGVGIWTDDTTVGATGNYIGLLYKFSQLEVTGWDVGIQVHYFDNLHLEDVLVKQCRIGFKASGNNNDLTLLNCGGSVCTETIYDFGPGGGTRFFPSDLITSARAVRLRANAHVVMLGGDFEDVGTTGTAAGQVGAEVILVEANASLVHLGGQFTNGAGTSTHDVTRYRVAGGVHVSGVREGGYTTPVITKSASTAVAYLQFPNLGLSAGGNGIAEAATGAQVRSNVFDMRTDNGVPAAAAVMRGGTLQAVGRDGTSIEDRLVHYIRRYNGTTYTYEAVDLTDPRHFYSTVGQAGARVDGVRHHVGRKAFTTAAATKTDVTIDVGAFGTILAATANVSLEGGNPTGPVSVAYKTNAAGVVTFTVFHPNDAAGSLSWRLMYRIDVSTA